MLQAASEASNVDTASVEPSISAALLNEMTLNEAIERLDDESVELYRKSGKQLVFPPDRSMSASFSRECKQPVFEVVASSILSVVLAACTSAEDCYSGLCTQGCESGDFIACPMD